MVRAIALTYLLLPFLEVNSESALRFDVPSLRLHFFGTALWVQEFYVVMLATLSGALLFFLLTLVLGRVWCGWVCPQTIVTDLTDPIVSLGRHGIAGKALSYFVLAGVALITGFSTVCYFVSPYEAITRIVAFNLGPIATGSIIVIALLVLANLVFLRRTFCSTICPYAKFQGAITDSKSLKICMDETRADECINCKQCVKTCPTGLDIREGVQVSCIMCGACIDACAPVMAGKGTKSLIGYQFGSSKTLSLAYLIRPGVLALSLLVISTFIMFSYQAFLRTSFDFSILPHSLTARYTKDGEIINAYILSIKNMDKDDLFVRLSVPDEQSELQLRLSITDPLQIHAGLSEKFPLFVRAKGAAQKDKKITLVLQDTKKPGHIIKKTAYFIVPQSR